MGKLEPEIFNREVRRIRQTYGGDRKWRTTAELSAYYLYWRDRESDREEDTFNLRELIDLSRIDRYMWDAVRLIAQEHLTRGDPLPVPLAKWIEHVLEDQSVRLRREKLRPRPRTGRRVVFRDLVMCWAIESLGAQGYMPTRSGGRRMACAEGGSACDIVGKAFGKGYKYAEEIWALRPPPRLFQRESDGPPWVTLPVRRWSSATSAGGGDELGPHGSTPSG